MAGRMHYVGMSNKDTAFRGFTVSLFAVDQIDGARLLLLGVGWRFWS